MSFRLTHVLLVVLGFVDFDVVTVRTSCHLRDAAQATRPRLRERSPRTFAALDEDMQWRHARVGRSWRALVSELPLCFSMVCTSPCVGNCMVAIASIDVLDWLSLLALKPLSMHAWRQPESELALAGCS